MSRKPGRPPKNPRRGTGAIRSFDQGIRPPTLTLPGAESLAEKEEMRAEVVRLYVNEIDMGAPEIAALLGISTRTVYRYLQTAKASHDVNPDIYLSGIIENSLVTLTDMSNEFRVRWREWVREDVVLAENFLKLFDRLYLRVRDLITVAYANQPEAAPELPKDPRLQLGDASPIYDPPQTLETPLRSPDDHSGVFPEDDPSVFEGEIVTPDQERIA